MEAAGALGTDGAEAPAGTPTGTAGDSSVPEDTDVPLDPSARRAPGSASVTEALLVGTHRRPVPSALRWSTPGWLVAPGVVASSHC
jgi:hypothetical protein